MTIENHAPPPGKQNPRPSLFELTKTSSPSSAVADDKKVLEEKEAASESVNSATQNPWRPASQPPNIAPKTNQRFLVTVRSQSGKIRTDVALFARDYWLEWVDEPADENDVDEEGGRKWNGWMEDRYTSCGDEMCCAYEGEIIAWMPMPAPSVGQPTEERSALPVTPNSSPAPPLSHVKQTRDSERLDWLGAKKQKHSAHWGGGPRADDSTKWVNPAASWSIVHRTECGTYDYPPELANLSIRDAIDAAMASPQTQISEDKGSATHVRQKERPVIFKAEMVRAILDGRKTQTRRVLKFDPLDGFDNPNATENLKLCPYGVAGDRLWVRESFVVDHYDFIPHGPMPKERPDHILDEHIYYRATCDGIPEYEGLIPWRPSIHMPRWASRITLEITGVRVERLQDISGEDVLREGVVGATRRDHELPSILDFRLIWGSINGVGAWDTNLWVWVIAFCRVAPPALNASGASSPNSAPSPVSSVELKGEDSLK